MIDSEQDQAIVLNHMYGDEWQRTKDILIDIASRSLYIPVYRVRAALKVLKQQNLVRSRALRYGRLSATEWTRAD